MPTRYRSLFFDLDDTLWAFSENAEDTFRAMYDKYGYGRFFRSFGHFYALYTERNLQLWEEYGQGRITKDELNRIRFLHPLQQVGVEDAGLAQAFADDFFAVIPTCKKLMPHAREVLDYLSGRYRLYILSNGFRELQYRKMCSAGIEGYFRRVVLSEDIGLLKPRKELFDFALSATQSEARDSLMIGDNWENDIAGARHAGWHQVYYAPAVKASLLPFRPTLCEARKQSNPAPLPRSISSPSRGWYPLDVTSFPFTKTFPPSIRPVRLLRDAPKARESSRSRRTEATVPVISLYLGS